MSESPANEVLTVTLNPALDRTVAVDNFTVGAVNRVLASNERAGGKGINVATVLADVGRRVAVTGFLGTRNAARFEALFAARKLDDHFVRLPGLTRVGIKIRDPRQHQTTDINFAGLEPAPGDIGALERRLRRLVQPGMPVVLAGSLPPGMSADSYADLTALLREREATVLVDTSGPALAAAVPAGPAILKPNVHELESLVDGDLGTEAAVAEAARSLLSRYTRLVVVSMGASGACFVTGRECFVAVPPAVQVLSTVGAGDALVAGIVLGGLRGLGLEDTARVATAFAVDRLTHLEAGIGNRSTIPGYARDVRIRPPHRP